MFNALPATRPLALLAAVLLSGCAIVRSVPGAHGSEGIGYMLPRALLPVELVFDGSAFELRIQPALLVGDAAHTYALQRSGNVFTSDNVVVNVDPVSGLLSAVNVKSEDKSVDAITKLVSGLKAEAAVAVGQVIVFQDLFDPGWDDQRVADFNRRLQFAARAQLRRAGIQAACTGVDGAATDPCNALATLQHELDGGDLSVAVMGSGAATPEPADCSAGFCYRINVPHVVRLQGPGTSSSAVFGLPNRSPTFVMPLERWAFVKTTHDVELQGGVFESITSDRPSSAYAVAALPFDIAKAAVTSASELIQLKLDFSGKQKGYYDAQVAEIEAKAARDKALLDKAPAEAEAAIWGMPAKQAAAPLTLRIGRPGSMDVNKDLKAARGKSDKQGQQAQNPEPGQATPAAAAASAPKTSIGSAGSAAKEKQ